MNAIEQWIQSQQRVIVLAEGMSAEQAQVRVPACPGWTTRELLAHMIGLDADVLAGSEPDDHNEAWTQAQVDARASDDVATLLAEWRELTGPMQRWMAENNTRPMGDVVIHEQDLRGALDQPGARDTPGLRGLREVFAGRLAAALESQGLAPVALVGADGAQVVGNGEPGLELTADEFDLTRMLMTRRSASQIRSWTTAGDVEAYLGVLALLGPLPEHDLEQ